MKRLIARLIATTLLIVMTLWAGNISANNNTAADITTDKTQVTINEEVTYTLDITATTPEVTVTVTQNNYGRINLVYSPPNGSFCRHNLDATKLICPVQIVDGKGYIELTYLVTQLTATNTFPLTFNVNSGAGGITQTITLTGKGYRVNLPMVR